MPSDAAGIGDSVVVDTSDDDTLDPDVWQPDTGYGYHSGKTWTIAQEPRGYYVTAEGYGAVTIANVTFFDTEADAQQARTKLIELVGGTEG